MEVPGSPPGCAADDRCEDSHHANDFACFQSSAAVAAVAAGTASCAKASSPCLFAASDTKGFGRQSLELATDEGKALSEALSEAQAALDAARHFITSPSLQYKSASCNPPGEHDSACIDISKLQSRKSSRGPSPRQHSRVPSPSPSPSPSTGSRSVRPSPRKLARALSPAQSVGSRQSAAEVD